MKSSASANQAIRQSANKSKEAPTHWGIRAAAFTIIEVLVAMAVLTILLTLLLNIVTSTTTLWRHSENRADAFREARAALMFISRDLATAYAQGRGDFLYGVDAVELLADKPAADWAANRNAVFFLAALPPSAQKSGENNSDICAVGYFVAFDSSYVTTDGIAPPTMNLYRYLLSSDETFDHFVNGDGAFQNGIASSNANVDLLARNIREFRVKPLSVEISGTQRTYGNFITSANTPLPDVVEVTIIAASRETAEKFPDRTDWITGKEALRRGEQTFTTRIPLRTAK